MIEPAYARNFDRADLLRHVMVVSEVRFVRERLAEVLADVNSVRVSAQAASFEEALELAAQYTPEILLLDASIKGGAATATQLCAGVPAAKLIAFGISETEEHVLTWVAAGIAGYVPNTASVDELVTMVEQISRGEQLCSPAIAGILLRQLGAASHAAHAPNFTAPLTRREQEIYDLVGAGLSNKAIARRLCINLATAKSHVHNLLGKLNLQRRTEVMLRHNPLPTATGAQRP